MNIVWNNLLIGLRILILSVVLVITVAVLFATTKSALAASLRDITVVNDHSLKLGDLFDGLQTNADYVLGPAPQPGQDMVLNARTLYRIAVAMDLEWRPTTSAEQVVVRRAATIVPADVVKLALKESIVAEGITGNFGLEFYSSLNDIVLPFGERESVEITQFSMDPQNDSFSAVIVAPSKDNPLSKIPVSGKIERLIDVPVLKSVLRNGDIIGETDVDWVEISARKIQHDMVMKVDELVGLTPRRASLAGKPILENELERPVLVKRGERVNIFYKDGPLLLSAEGKALQNGAKGDRIRLTNTLSRQVIEGFVSNSNEVIVQ